MDPLFSFPFKPYAIQETFMKELYLTIQRSQSGIFESPTGTGKSLSICCGVLQWYNDYNNKVQEDLEKEINSLKSVIVTCSETDDWLQEEYKKVQNKQKLANLQSKLERIIKRAAYFNEMKNRVAKQKSNIEKKIEYIEKRVKAGDKENVLDNQVEEDTDLILDEVPNDDDQSGDDEDEQEVEDDMVKIYISSRTHSQLSQFIGEIKRTVFKDDTRVVTLASRQHYCINSDVNRLKNINLINERCLDIQKKTSKVSSVSEEGKALKKSKTKSCSSCPYYNQTNISRLKDQLLVEILDMEDLVKAGKELKACPYYASRMALQDSQVVLISHAGIVSSGARSGISLKLNNNILILDEAHGLTAALENAHSAPVSYKQLASVKTYLKFYVDKYRARLSSRNLLSVNQLLFVVGRFLAMITQKTESKKEEETTIYTLEDFVIKAEIDNLNLRPLAEFARSSRLAPKLHGFSMKYNQQLMEEQTKEKTIKKSNFESFLSNIAKKKNVEAVVEESKPEPKPFQPVQDTSAGSGLYSILDLIDRLCDRSENGRVLAQKGTEQNGQLKYLLLNPAEHFVDVVKQCRSVIVAGGTMEPISEFQSLLTGSCSPSDDVTVVRCEHVVPADHVLAVCLEKGPSNKTLNFSYENRNSLELVDEIGRILRNLSSIIPGGVVCFFPSYAFEQSVYEHLKSSKVIENIEKKKRVFREPKSAAEVDQVLHKFAQAVKSKESGRNGALLLSVVGGKLSEGLNFSDDLGRCVIVVGMPYPNVKSPELQEKMAYLNRTAGTGAGNIYYENLCMKAVNQCIGRAVRHARDFACVVLADARYSRPHSAAALPSFVQKSLIPNSNFGPTIGNIAKFFAKHKNKS